MSDALAPVAKQSLSDQLAARIRSMIQRGDYRLGDRLPAIMEIARDFGVGHPTVREGLKKLETIGVVKIRHGSGVYVTRCDEVLVLAAPDYPGMVNRKLLLDLIRARLVLELRCVADAVENATAEDLRAMRRGLTAADPRGTGEESHAVDTSFHRQIATASGNVVLRQLLDVLGALFSDELRRIRDHADSRDVDHRDHLAILEALERRDVALGMDRMRRHLQRVEAAIEQWDPERQRLVD